MWPLRPPPSNDAARRGGTSKKKTLKKLPIGISDFTKVREEDRYFVDKSLLIKEIIDEEAEIALLPRPRRFGKTLNLSMLKCFFEKRGDKDRKRALFRGLRVEKDPDFDRHFFKYPVIYLTFKDVKALDFENAFEAIRMLLADEFQRHADLLDSDRVSRMDKDRIENIIYMQAAPAACQRALKDLSACLHRHHGEKPLILIDEYDSPIHAAYSGDYYEEIIDFFRSFLSAGLKDNPHIHKGVLTGILRVAKESIFSDMNNLSVYSVLSGKFSDKFGLTEKEVEELLRHHGLEKEEETVKAWYNGYIFKENVIYNPWSIINYVSNISDGPKAYWANTSSNRLIKDLVQNAPYPFKEEMRDLLKDIPVEKRVEENVVFEDLGKDDVAIYSFLVFCGYLNAFDTRHVENEYWGKLLIPNLEVKLIFKNIILQWINESYENHKLTAMLKALTGADVKTFEKILGDFVLETLSYFDTAGKSVEKVYQAFILGLLVNLAPEYEVNSEKESGYGRYDISVIPKDKNATAVVMELKTIDSDETKDQALESALGQIEEKQYAAAVMKSGVKDVLRLAVVFDGKRAWARESSPATV
ncbi:PD-(D/E)XK nuclease superfamily protein [Candidatus Desulfarcum epimagneticum]|uniref:PD-(D/E)XK nuclease superfamily protein n=1 Tax=uncultured Desulfobacteraceae bacterium TaxID=218296 RepID=A0A484HGP5_9BACT|nr:PD-(D/E)XK nuclease superfamily protein [uncultured Desulfobacteraceae bacterium]